MKIMAIDDEKIALGVLTSAISAALPEAKVYEFRNSASAIKYAKKNEADVVFCDYKMPEMNGIELCKEIRKYIPNIDIVFVTGYSEYASDAVNELCPQGYIVKPVSAKKVKAIVKNLSGNSWHKGLYIYTFGTFEVFYDNVPVEFKVKKAKELFAYLIDRSGAVSSRKELITVLYEEKNEKNASRYFADAVSCLSETLAELGEDDIFVRGFNSYSVDRNKLNCDLYKYLNGEKDLFRGEYMKQYPWGEYFIGTVVNKQ